MRNRSTKSKAGNSRRAKRKASRAKRLIRLRNTEVGACLRATTRPKRPLDMAFGAYWSWKCTLANERRKANTRE